MDSVAMRNTILGVLQLHGIPTEFCLDTNTYHALIRSAGSPQQESS